VVLDEGGGSQAASDASRLVAMSKPWFSHVRRSRSQPGAVCTSGTSVSSWGGRSRAAATTKTTDVW
jgi:hypothetical protein